MMKPFLPSYELYVFAMENYMIDFTDAESIEKHKLSVRNWKLSEKESAADEEHSWATLTQASAGTDPSGDDDAAVDGDDDMDDDDMGDDMSASRAEEAQVEAASEIEAMMEQSMATPTDDNFSF